MAAGWRGGRDPWRGWGRPPRRYRPRRYGRRRTRWRGAGPVLGLLVVVAGVAGAGLLLVGRPRHVSPASSAARSAGLSASLATDPPPGSAGVALDTPVTVTTRSGHLRSVRVAPASGAADNSPLQGALDPSGTRWTSAGALQASTTYRITATVLGAEGGRSSFSSVFSTLTPAAWVGMGIWPDSGLTVGVGQPVVLTFTRPVTDPAARQSLVAHLHLTLSEPVAVGSYWFSATELHLRPQAPWPTGERISVSDSLDGWDAGGGNWGRGSGSVSFTVGPARVSVANLATHRMTVTEDGRVVATFPISAGSARYPTMDGVHVVLDRESRVQMVSSTVGIPVHSPGGYDETVLWDVHISDSGEYVHAAPWSVSAQGYENVSHGCINLSPTDARAFFNFSRVGDLVYVTGGPRPPVPGDHGVMDWDTPWASFTPFPTQGG